MSTIGLYMIVKDEVTEVTKLLKEAEPYFDGLYLTISDKKAYTKLKNIAKGYESGKIHLDYRPWNNRFDDARNHNFSKGETDYGFWLDADDEFEFAAIPNLLALAEDENVDAVWLPYEYAYDDDGNCIALHWRERLLNLHKDFEWRGWVHENFLCDEPIKSKRVNIPVKHRSTHHKGSEQRNHAILEEAYEATNDPRYVHYLGISYFSQERWQDAIDTLKEYVSVGGWDEEIYRSLIRMSEAANNLNDYEEAMQYVLRAVGLLPEYPQGYFTLANLEFDHDNYKQCLEWLKVAFRKEEPESASITDPTIPDRAKMMGAICEYKLGNNREAADLLSQVKVMDVSDLQQEFQKEASIDNLASILPALYKHYDNPKFLWENLNDELKYDNRFRKIRERVTEPKTWPKKSIVFFCGKGYEEWGPHTLDKGMGGSEEAIVYLSQELANLGYEVTVFGEVREPLQTIEGLMFYNPGNKKPVIWLPWTHIDKRDHFDTLVVWRYPQYASQFKANKMIVDMHDLLPEKIVKPLKGVTYMFKSDFHAKQYPSVENFNVVSNGVVKEQFDEKA